MIVERGKEFNFLRTKLNNSSKPVLGARELLEHKNPAHYNLMEPNFLTPKEIPNQQNETTIFKD